MKRKLVISLIAIGICSSVVVFGQSSGDNYEIIKHTVDSGGGTSVGGNFALTGTIGQPDAGPQVSTGGGFILAGGFWGRASSHIFSDGFEAIAP